MKKIGVVGYSGRPFDQQKAKELLSYHISHLCSQYGSENLEIVSGYTNIGIPRLVYLLADELNILLADELNITTVGITAKEALSVDCGLYPVKKVIVEGEHFGDESAKLIDYIDILIRVGGGNQSLKEVKMFKEKYQNENLDLILFEEELEELK